MNLTTLVYIVFIIGAIGGFIIGYFVGIAVESRSVRKQIEKINNQNK